MFGITRIAAVSICVLLLGAVPQSDPADVPNKCCVKGSIQGNPLCDATCVVAANCAAGVVQQFVLVDAGCSTDEDATCKRKWTQLPIQLGTCAVEICQDGQQRCKFTANGTNLQSAYMTCQTGAGTFTCSDNDGE